MQQLLQIRIFIFLSSSLQSTRQPNHFETIGVPPNAPARVVSSTYRKLSLQYHPDKNPSMEAKEMFAKIREAHEVIGSEKRRDAFCRFGDFSSEGAIDEEQFYDVLLVALFHCLIPFIFGYLHTFGDTSTASRQFFCSYLALVFAAELLLRFDSCAYGLFSFVPIVGSYLPFEKVVFLHNWVPIILNGLLLLGQDFADQEEELREEVCRHLLKSALDNVTQLEAFLDVAESLLLSSRTLPMRTRWARPKQLEAEAAAAAESAAAQSKGDAAAKFLARLSARRTQQQLLRDRAKEDAEVAAVLRRIPFKESVSPKAIEAERKTQLTALGFQEVIEPATPWRLDPNPPLGEETPDLWASAMENESRSWPDGFVLDDLLTRGDCTTYGWDLKRKQFLKLLDRYDEDAERGSGISLGTVIFFGMIFIRWYSG
ncbi:hypothetical protein Esti_004348 [Eimeria stiedai]